MDDQTAVMYINGEEVVSQSGLVTEFNRLKVDQSLGATTLEGVSG